VSGTGVVDAIRIPPWIREPAERWWREMPRLARVFVGLALLDIVGRSFGVLAPGIPWGYLTPLSFVSAFVPHDLWIVLPALLVIRRPDAEAATPWVVRGAIVLAVAEFASGPGQAILGGVGGASTISVLVGAAASLGILAAWLLLGRGLAVLTPREPSQTVTQIANLAVAALGLLAALYLADTLVSPGFDFGDPAYNQAVTLSNLTGPFRVLAWAYLVWVVIRGFGDTRRPAIATATAGTGAILAAFIVPAASVAARLLGALGVDLSGGSGFGEVFLIVSWLGDIVGPSLIAIAFVLGLAEPPTAYQAPAAPIEASEPADGASTSEPAEQAESTSSSEPADQAESAEPPSASRASAR
jgi:hypothetical protein